MTTSKEMIEYLKRSLLPDEGWPRGLFATEVEVPRERKLVRRRGRVRSKKTGPRRRADALWVPANTGTIHGYEIKVSRADLLVELRDPGKADAWSQYCNSFSLFIADASMIAGLEERIPAFWGILGPPARPGWRKLTTVRPPADLEPVDQHLGFARLIAWQAWQRHKENEELATLRRLEQWNRERMDELAARLDQYEIDPETGVRYVA